MSRNLNNNSNNRRTMQTRQVYAPDFSSVLSIPTRDIHQMPPEHLNVTRLVLCANYNATTGTGCAMGSRCKFVHASTANIRTHDIHVNYAWRSAEDVSYERYEPGQVFHVAPPNSKTTTDVMDSHLVLKTRALESKRRPLSHCAHFYFNRTCNLGSKCQFIHAVFIDPNAKDHQRAPVPSQLGGGRELQLSKKQREASASAVATAAQTAAATPRLVSRRDSSLDVSDLAVALAAGARAADMVSCHTPSNGSAHDSARSATPVSVCGTPSELSVSVPRAPRFRHDPYSSSNTLRAVVA